QVMARMLEWNNFAITRYAFGHLVSSSLCRDFLVRSYRVDPSRVGVVAQGVPKLFVTTPTRSLTINRLNRMLHVAQFAFVKGQVILCQAVTELLRNNSHSSFTWVCDSRHHPQALAMFPTDVHNRIALVGNMEQEQLLELYDDHGIFVFPSFFEGFGKAFLEAMARGMVVIATYEGGMKDLVTDCKNGYLVQKGDPVAIVERVMWLWGHADEAIAISDKARATAQAYTWRRFADESVVFYRWLLSERLRAVRSIS
ncbi:MAG: glycosyltransferase family 4 protein, partial [Casimicrobiaceae bacterium]